MAMTAPTETLAQFESKLDMRVYAEMAALADGEGRVKVPYSTLAERVGAGRTTVFRACDRLVRLGYLSLTSGLVAGEKSTANTYQLRKPTNGAVATGEVRGEAIVVTEQAQGEVRPPLALVEPTPRIHYRGIPKDGPGYAKGGNGSLPVNAEVFEAWEAWRATQDKGRSFYEHEVRAFVHAFEAGRGGTKQVRLREDAARASGAREGRQAVAEEVYAVLADLGVDGLLPFSDGASLGAVLRKALDALTAPAPAPTPAPISPLEALRAATKRVEDYADELAEQAIAFAHARDASREEADRLRAAVEAGEQDRKDAERFRQMKALMG
jgi:hypothetical protein